MIKVLFICHGNICRSPMAEFMLKDGLAAGDFQKKFYIESAATSRKKSETMYTGEQKAKLREAGIPFEKRAARQVTKADYDRFDYLIVMDEMNIRNLRRIIPSDSENKIYKLLDFAGCDRDIADPWYTGNFDDTYNDIKEGLDAFLQKIK